MTTHTDVERVARALCREALLRSEQKMNKPYDEPWRQSIIDRSWDSFEDAAIAAIGAYCGQGEKVA
jgi:hypothetical protein